VVIIAHWSFLFFTKRGILGDFTYIRSIIIEQEKKYFFYLTLFLAPLFCSDYINVCMLSAGEESKKTPPALFSL
tara:strand:- start:501 stop:722 length:222 start_codon:yes stop_codon:yes gene_type:complete